MPRNSLVVQDPPGPYPATPLSAGAALMTTEAADVANGNQWKPTGKDILIVRNGAGTTQTITFTSAPDEQNRKGTISAYSMGTEWAAFGPFEPDGWVQSDGYIYVDCSHAGMILSVIAV